MRRPMRTSTMTTMTAAISEKPTSSQRTRSGDAVSPKSEKAAPVLSTCEIQKTFGITTCCAAQRQHVRDRDLGDAVEQDDKHRDEEEDAAAVGRTRRGGGVGHQSASSSLRGGKPISSSAPAQRPQTVGQRRSAPMSVR